jgi:integrase
VKRSKKPQLTADEIRSLFNCFDDDFKVLMIVIAVASLRIGEVLALWWEDFDPVRSSLNVMRTLWKTERGSTKTESSSATLHLPIAITNALRVHRACSANTAPTDYIFCWPDGRPYYEEYLLDKVLYPALKRAGIHRQKYTTGFHLFR